MNKGPFGAYGVDTSNERVREGEALSRTAPGRLEGVDNDSDEDDNNALFKVDMVVPWSLQKFCHTFLL